MGTLARLLAATSTAASIAVACSGGAMPEDVRAPDTLEVSSFACPDGLVLWEEYNVCAPRVDECEDPWELPIIGGGCMAIGPRACPKLWDPNADVDCEPGELITYNGSACPEGFVLTEDEIACIPFFEENCGDMEIPVLGGGCRKIGPEWGEEGEPYFDDCPGGLLAREAGGCIQVGPRACPRLWDQDAEADCEIGDVLPCPEGWSESDDGMYCDPGYADCGPGERALVGGACERVVPLPEDCPAGPFPDAPDGATDAVYVSSDSECEIGCGSQAMPYSDINSGLVDSPDGGYLLVAAGNYDEGLLVQRPVHVLGLCASKVMIAGAVDVPGDESKVKRAGIAIFGTQNVEVSGIAVAAPAAGVAVVESAGVELTELELTGAEGVALYVGSGSEVGAHSLWLHDTVASDDAAWMTGHGVWAGNGAALVVLETLIDRSRGAGMHVSGSKTSVTIRNSEIRNTQSTSSAKTGTGMTQTDLAVVLVEDSLFSGSTYAGLHVGGQGSLQMRGTQVRKTLPDSSGKGGVGLRATDGSTATVSNCIFQGNREMGIYVAESGTLLEASAIVVRTTAPNILGEFGHGMEVAQGAGARVQGCLLEHNTVVGLLATDSNTQFEVAATVVRGTKPNSANEGGHGIEASWGATATASSCLVEANGVIGVAVWNVGTHLELLGTVVRDTEPLGSGQGGHGMTAANGCTAAIHGSLLEGNTGFGIGAWDQGTKFEVSATVVRDTMADSSGGGHGMELLDGAVATVSASRFEHNLEVGVWLDGSGTHLEMSDTVVRDTLPTPAGEFGHGLHVGNGGAAALSGCRFESNSNVGISLIDAGALLELSATVVRETNPNSEGNGGLGIVAREGATALVFDCLLDRNSGYGLWVGHEDTELHMSGCAIRDTQPNASGQPGEGLHIGLEAQADVHGCVFERNAEFGLWAGHEGTHLNMYATAVRGTLAGQSGDFGYGLQVGEAATAVATACLIDRDTSVGVLVVHSDSRLDALSTVIRDTHTDPHGMWGTGLVAQAGAEANLSGCLLERNTEGGLWVSSPGTQGSLVATIVRDTMPAASGVLGVGAEVWGGASLTAAHSLFIDNSTAGLVASGEGTMLALEASAVFNTAAGGGRASRTEVYGDGAVADDGAVMHVDGAVVAGNSRSGIYYSAAAGSISDCIVFGNDSYGIALDQSTEAVIWEGRGNHVFGNQIEPPVCVDPIGQSVPPTAKIPSPPEVTGDDSSGEG